MKNKLLMSIMPGSKLAAALFVVFLAVAAASDAGAEFFDNAFANAAKPPGFGQNGLVWVITAKVYLKGSGKEYISATGRVTLSPDGTLAGELPMSINNSPVADNTIKLNIRKSSPAVVVVSRNIAGKPFLGRRPALASLKVDPAFNYLLGQVDWSDGKREMQVFLESAQVKKSSLGGGAGSGQADTPKRKGARYQIGGFMRVSNSNDGLGDNTVEVYGKLYLHHIRNGQDIKTWTLIDVIEQDANNGFQLEFNKNNFIDIYDDELKTDTFNMTGFIQDRDRGQGLSGDDLMFSGPSCMTNWPVYTLVRFTAGQGSQLCDGDKKDESADVRIFMKKIKDL